MQPCDRELRGLHPDNLQSVPLSNQHIQTTGISEPQAHGFVQGRRLGSGRVAFDRVIIDPIVVAVLRQLTNFLSQRSMRLGIVRSHLSAAPIHLRPFVWMGRPGAVQTTTSLFFSLAANVVLGILRHPSARCSTPMANV